MADESIVVEVQDKVSSTIGTKLKDIAEHSRQAFTAVEQLKSLLASLDVGALRTLASASSNATRILNQNAIAAQRLAREQQNTAAAAARAAAAQTRSTTAQTQGATAAQRLATETQRTAREAANVAAAQDRAALAALRLQQAQQRAAAASERAANGMLSWLRRLAAFAGIAISATAIVNVGDAYTTLQNKLQNVAESQAQVNELTGRLFDLANRTRAPVDETTTAFARFDRALKSLGKSQDDSLRLTETVNKALVISGATSTEAASSLLQLSQAFNSGRLQGDEFRAISENMPIVLDAVAKALGKPINEVKRLSTEGKITAEVLYNAFKLIEDQVDNKFAKTIPTIGQALTVLKNKATQAFGEFNKATGITQGISKAIIFLADHMKGLAVTAAIAGAALLVAFGPVILSAIASATTAVLGFTAALLANPIGLIVVGITAAAAALYAFGDSTNAGIDDVTTLSDVASAAWEEIKAGAEDLGSVIAGLWDDGVTAANTALESISGSVSDASKSWTSDYSDFFTSQYSGWASALDIAAKTIDAIAGLLTGLGIAIYRVFAGIPHVIDTAFKQAYNFIVGWNEKIVNNAIDAINKLRKLVGTDLIANVKFERKKVDEKAYEDYGKSIASSIYDGMDIQGGYLQGVLKNTFNRAQQIAKGKGTSATSTLRGAGAATAGSGSGGKSAEKRAAALAKVNAQLDNEIARMDMLKPMRDVQQKFDQIEESLIGKRITLTTQEADAIKSKLVAIQKAADVQQASDRIYEQAIGPARDYNATLEAATHLLDTGAISFSDFSREVIKAGEAYKASLDPLYQYTRDLEQEMSLLQMLPKQREIEQRVMQVQNDLLQKGIILNDTQLSQLREELQLRQQLDQVAQAKAQLLGNSVDKRDQFSNQVTALKQLGSDSSSGFTQGDQAGAASSMLQGMGIDTSAMSEQLQANAEVMRNYYAQVDEMRQADVISEQTANAAKMQIFAMTQRSQLQGTQSFLSGLSTLQSSHNKKQARIGKAAAIANATINTYLSATEAFASLAGIPIVGPILGAIAAAAAVASGLAQIQQIRSTNTTGFMQGGYTGNVPTNAVAGVVHGQEWVSDANTTRRYRPYLESMSNGTFNPEAAAPAAHGASAGGSNGPVVVPPSMVKVVNVKSMDEARDFANSEENEQVVLNILQKNGVLSG